MVDEEEDKSSVEVCQACDGVVCEWMNGNGEEGIGNYDD